MLLACVLMCFFAASHPVADSGFGFARPSLVAPDPASHSAAAVPASETVSHSGDITHVPVEQHGYIVKLTLPD